MTPAGVIADAIWRHREAYSRLVWVSLRLVVDEVGDGFPRMGISIIDGHRLTQGANKVVEIKCLIWLLHDGVKVK